MRTQIMVSATTNLAPRFMLVVLNAELIAPTIPAMSVTGTEQFAFSVLAAGEEGLAVIFLCLVYMS